MPWCGDCIHLWSLPGVQYPSLSISYCWIIGGWLLVSVILFSMKSTKRRVPDQSPIPLAEWLTLLIIKHQPAPPKDFSPAGPQLVGIVSLCDAEIQAAPSCNEICSGVQVKDCIIPSLPFFSGWDCQHNQNIKRIKLQPLFCLLRLLILIFGLSIKLLKLGFCRWSGLYLLAYRYILNCQVRTT